MSLVSGNRCRKKKKKKKKKWRTVDAQTHTSSSICSLYICPFFSSSSSPSLRLRSPSPSPSERTDRLSSNMQREFVRVRSVWLDSFVRVHKQWEKLVRDLPIRRVNVRRSLTNSTLKFVVVRWRIFGLKVKNGSTVVVSLLLLLLRGFERRQSDALTLAFERHFARLIGPFVDPLLTKLFHFFAIDVLIMVRWWRMRSFVVVVFVTQHFRSERFRCFCFVKVRRVRSLRVINERWRSIISLAVFAQVNTNAKPTAYRWDRRRKCLIYFSCSSSSSSSPCRSCWSIDFDLWLAAAAAIIAVISCRRSFDVRLVLCPWTTSGWRDDDGGAERSRRWGTAEFDWAVAGTFCSCNAFCCSAAAIFSSISAFWAKRSYERGEKSSSETKSTNERTNRLRTIDKTVITSVMGAANSTVSFIVLAHSRLQINNFRSCSNWEKMIEISRKSRRSRRAIILSERTASSKSRIFFCNFWNFILVFASKTNGAFGYRSLRRRKTVNFAFVQSSRLPTDT